jgi:hypothetical protein
MPAENHTHTEAVEVGRVLDLELQRIEAKFAGSVRTGPTRRVPRRALR